jgi:hypothetical protein
VLHRRRHLHTHAAHSSPQPTQISHTKISLIIALYKKLYTGRSVRQDISEGRDCILSLPQISLFAKNQHFK